MIPWLHNSDGLFKGIFIASFIYAVVVAAATAKRAARAHGGSVNQLRHEIRWLIAVRAALGIVFYASLTMWLVRDHAPAWASLSIPVAYRWISSGLAERFSAEWARYRRA